MPSKDTRASVVLVNEQGQPIGSEEKMKAHREGLLHKAFSVFIFNSSGEMLLQQRAFTKYHFAGLWSNTCCSHPAPEEDLYESVHRRLKEEMGFDAPLKEAFSFIYKIRDHKSNLYEHEFDVVFIGIYDGEIVPDYHEIHAYRWVKPETIYRELQADPSQFTGWFKIALEKLTELKLLPGSR